MSDPFDTFVARAGKLGVDFPPERVPPLRIHLRLLLATNRNMNLTRVTDPAEAVKKLYLASLAVFPALRAAGLPDPAGRCLDLGTGAGFPGVPVAAAAQGLTALLVDARRKKADFLSRALGEAGLGNAVARHARGADLASEFPGRFDLVVSKAVGTAAEVVREVAALVAPGGVVALGKGPNLAAEEVAEGAREARRRGFVACDPVTVEVEDLAPRILLYRREA